MAVVFPVRAVAGVVCVAAGSAGASRAMGSSVPHRNAHREGKLLQEVEHLHSVLLSTLFLLQRMNLGVVWAGKAFKG